MRMELSTLYRWIFLCLLHIHHTYGGQDPQENRMTDDFKNLTKVIRIFERAPRGTFVHKFQMQTLLDVVQNKYFKVDLSGADETKFKLSSNVLKVDQYPRLFRPLGQKYYVSVELATVEEPYPIFAIVNLEIIVSRKNKLPPRFKKEVYTAEVFRYSQPGRKILQIGVEDDDEEYYNRETVFGVTQPNQPPIAVDIKNGTIMALTSVREAETPVINAEITATNAGSPPLSVKKNLTIFVRDISEPQNVTVQIMNLTSVKVCWHKPRYGRVRKYELRYGSTERPNEHERKLIHRSQETGRQCTRLRSLTSFAENWMEIRAWNPPDPGVPIKINFRMEKDMCNDHPCYGGKCMRMDREPGYRCICPDGTEGDTCEHFFSCEGPDCTIADQIDDCDCSDPRERIRQRCEEKCKKECQNGGSPMLQLGRYSCACPKGYFGDSCDLFDPCSQVECNNGAACRNISSTQFKCDCLKGFFGETCEHHDPCSHEPCLNGGNCRNISDTEYYCNCYYGFFGQNCTRFDPCASSPCQNNGLCRNLSDSDYMCKCQPGFYGYDCELYSPCADNPCLFGGMCNSIDGKYVCECPIGRFGKRCGHLNMCIYHKPCGPHSVTCHNISDTKFNCVCEPGWSGPNCTKYNPCHENPCQEGGQCKVRKGQEYVCKCKPGYYGRNCEFRNHCHSNPCKNGGVCANSSDTGFSCLCKEGYFGEKCETFNPCVKAACMNDARCINTSSTTYECVCEPPYYGDLCQMYNGCHSNPCNHGNCEVTGNNKFECNCELGYFGPECQYYDPCASDPCKNRGECTNLSDEKYECNCADDYFGMNCESYDACHSNPCVAGACRNLPDGSYRCDCPAGRFGDKCQSTDPCAGKPCLHSGTCFPHDGLTYSCTCPKGYYGSTCESFNPCTDDPCKHEGTCVHLSGNKFRCDCSIEFQGGTCESEVPCNAHGKRCYNDGNCQKAENGTMQCICAEGYYGFRCQRYNPCSLPKTCLNEGTCEHLESGMYRCRCALGFFGDKCEYHRPCNNYICQHNGTCVYTARGDVCYCRDGFSGELCEKDLDECESNPCRNGGVCEDQPGGYRCSCPEGFTGQTCRRAEMCRRDIYFEAKGTFVWPSTAHGETALIECPRTKGKYASRECLLGHGRKAKWGDSDTSQCGMTVHTQEQALEALKPFTNDTETVSSVWKLTEATRVLEATIGFACDDDAVAAEMIDIIDLIVGLDTELIAASNTSGRVLAVLENFMSNAKWLQKNITYSRKNLEMELRPITFIEHDYGTNYYPKSAPMVYITLPQDVFLKDASSDRVKFLYLASNNLFLNPDHPSQWKDLGNVIAAGVGQDVTIRDLPQKGCVQYAVPNRKITRHNRCVFWNKKTKTWIADGIETVSYRGPKTTCCSSHLTYFTVTADPEVSAITAVEEDFRITIASHGGLGVAILLLSVVLFTYSVFRSLNRENFGQLVIQMTGSLLFLNVCTLVGYNRYQIDDNTVCMVVAILTHYFNVASLLWSAVAAHFVFRSVSTEYAVPERIFLCKRFLFAWGLPAIPLSIAIGVDMDSYKHEPESCVFSSANKYLFYSTYLLPVCLIMFANAVLFVLIIKGVCSSNFSKRKADSLRLCQIFGTLFIVTVAAVTWVFGYLATMHQLIKFSVYFHYTYYGLNGLLGLSIFLFYFLFRTEGRAAWRQCCVKKKGISSRRRIAGKSNINTTTIKGERDYRLVVDRAKGAHGSTSGDRERILRPDTQGHTVQDAVVPSTAREAPEGGVSSRLQVQRPHYRVLHDSEASYPSSPAHSLARSHVSAGEERHREAREANTPLRLAEDDGFVHTRV